MDFTDLFFRNALLKKTERKRFFNAKQFYWDCIVSHGEKYYDSATEYREYSDSDQEEDPYRFFLPEKEESVIKFCNECNSQLTEAGMCKYCKYVDPKLGFQESQQMYVSGRFNRTFISPDSDFTTRSGKRLIELQKWVTIVPEEMELKKVGEIIEGSLNFLKLYENPNIFKTALNMYYNIMEYYKTNTLRLNVNKGNLKKGYILLCIYYSLMYYKQLISKEKLVRSIPDYNISYLPIANKNILRIFENVHGYEFMFAQDQELPVVTSLCGLVSLLPKNVSILINKVKQELIERGIFQKKMTNIQIAACIYYVCNVITSPRLEIIINGQKTKITHALLSSKCGSFASATLTKQVDLIRHHFTS
jgi:hypothetical protein